MVEVRASTAMRALCWLAHSNKHQHRLRVFVRCTSMFFLLVVRSLRRGAHLSGECHSTAPDPQSSCFGAAQRCSPQYVEIDRPIFDACVRSFVGATTSN